MKPAVFLAMLVTLATHVAAAVERATQARDRAYFRAETPEARRQVAPFVTHELPGGVLCVASSPSRIDELAASPGIIFLGFETVHEPAPIEFREVGDRTPSPHAAADPVRTCFRPGWMTQVGWGIKALYDDPALERPTGGAGVRIGLIDSGVAPHLDLVGRVVKCVDLTGSNLPPCADSMGHGTMVASVIAADGGFDGLGMYGMAPEASIYSYRVCTPAQECFPSYIAAAIHQAIADGVNIINLSIVSPGQDAVVRAAVDSALAHNILVVSAAGNRPQHSFVGWPAANSKVVSVGAIAENRAPWSFTPRGINDGDYVREDREIEIAAPGAGVQAATKSGCWVLANGTSVASPLVAGLAAKLWNGDAVATRGRLRAAARLYDLHVAGDDSLTGIGLPTLRRGPIIAVMTTGVGAVRPAGVVAVEPGASQSFTIETTSDCYWLEDVRVDGVSMGPITSYAFTGVTDLHTIEGVFAERFYDIDASADPGGIISPSGVSGVACGSTARYVILASGPCYRIQDVVVDGASQGAITSFTFTNVRTPHTIRARFTQLAYAIDASAAAGGTITPGGITSVPCGTSQTYEINPDPCRRILDVKVDGASQGPITSYTFTDVRAAHTIQVSFEALGPFTIAASAGAGGTIHPSGASSVPCGGSQSYTIAADGPCRLIGDVQVDGATVGAVSEFTFRDVQAHHAIAAAFAAADITLRETHSDVGGTADGAIDLTVEGGAPPYTYDWSNGAATEDLASLAAGTYTVRVADARGCTHDLSVTIANLGPLAPELGRPMPNPARGPVRFRYGLPAETAVRLSVVDLKGRELAVLVRGIQPAGWAWAAWSGETSAGRAPGGMYFLHLEAGGRRVAQRFALIR